MILTLIFGNKVTYRHRLNYRCFMTLRLPTELKPLRSTDSFRRDLKTFLFHSVHGTKIRIDSVVRLGLLVGGGGRNAVTITV